MTLSQRYRGTEWGQPLDTPSGGPKHGRRPGRKMLVVLLAGLAIAGIGGWTALGGRLPVVPGASPTPAKPNSAFAQRFLKLVTKDPFTYHLAYRATLKTGDQTATVATDVDVAGADFTGTTKVQRGGARIALDVVLTGGRAYGRLPKAGWAVIPAVELATPASPFEALAATSSLEDLGEATRSGKKLRRLRTSQWLGGDPNRLLAGQAGSVTVESSTFEVFVTSAGVPVDAVLTAELKGNIGGESQTATVRATYAFSNVGRPVKVNAPKLR
jgi:hypothetical protein